MPGCSTKLNVVELAINNSMNCSRADLVFGINPLEHRRIFQHVRDDDESDSAAADKYVFQVTYSPILHKEPFVH